MTPKFMHRLIVVLLPFMFLSFADGEEPTCVGCEVGTPLLEATNIKNTGERVTITVDSTDGACYSALNPPSLWICHPDGCTFEVTRTWSDFAPGTPIEDCWGWQNPRSGVELTRNCDVTTPGPVVNVSGSGSSLKVEVATCQTNGYFWEMNVGGLTTSVSTVCTACAPVED